MEIRVKYPHSWVGHIPFAVYLVQKLKPRIIVELGTHSGNSFFAFLFGVKNFSPKTMVYAVDLWNGDNQAGYYDESVYLELKEYLDSNFSEFGRLVRKDFNEAVNDFKDNSIDVLHIDGLHTYEAVKNDFLKWKPKLTKNAIVLFHDTNVIQDGFGVNLLWNELKSIYSNNFEFSHSNGLGVIKISNEKCKFINSFKTNKYLIEHYEFVGNILLENQVQKDMIKYLQQKASILDNSKYIKIKKLLLNHFKFGLK